MKKWELIAKACEQYPKGTIFWWPNDTRPVKTISSGRFKFNFEKDIIDVEHPTEAVFNGEKWAEIVENKEPLPLMLFHGMKCVVKEKGSKCHEIEIYDADNLVTVLSPSDIEDISHALKQLSC